MKNIILLLALVFAHASFAQPTPTDYQYVVDNNVLTNPGFENGLTGATVTGCVKSIETSTVFKGKQSLKVVCTAQTLSLTLSSTARASQFPIAKDGTRTFWYQQPSRVLQACPIQAGVDGLCTDLEKIGAWDLQPVLGMFGPTSNGIKVKTAGPVTGTFYFDEAVVSPISMLGAVSMNGPRTPYTPTTSGFTTVPTCFYTVMGPGVYLDCSLANTASSGSEARLSLPPNMVTPTDFTGTRAVGVVSESVADVPMFTVLIEPGVSYLTFGFQSSTTAGLTKILGTSLTGSSTRQSFTAWVPIAGLQSTIPSFAKDCTNPLKCVTSISGAVSLTGVVTRDSLGAVVGPCTVSGTSVRTCGYNSAMGLTQPMNCTIGTTEANVLAPVTTTTSTSFAVTTYAASTNALYNSPFTYHCTKTGQDLIDSMYLQIIGTFRDVPKMGVTPTGKPRIISIRFGQSNTGTICTSGNCFIGGTSIIPAGVTLTALGSGAYRINNIQGDNYACIGVGFAPGVSGTFGNDSASTSTTKTIGFSAGTGANQDSYGTIFCLGWDS